MNDTNQSEIEQAELDAIEAVEMALTDIDIEEAAVTVVACCAWIF